MPVLICRVRCRIDGNRANIHFYDHLYWVGDNCLHFYTFAEAFNHALYIGA